MRPSDPCAPLSGDAGGAVAAQEATREGTGAGKDELRASPGWKGSGATILLSGGWSVLGSRPICEPGLQIFSSTVCPEGPLPGSHRWTEEETAEPQRLELQEPRPPCRRACAQMCITSWITAGPRRLMMSGSDGGHVQSHGHMMPHHQVLRPCRGPGAFQKPGS